MFILLTTHTTPPSPLVLRMNSAHDTRPQRSSGHNNNNNQAGTSSGGAGGSDAATTGAISIVTGGGNHNNPANVLRTIGNTFNISNNQLNTIHSVATGQVFG